MKTLQRTGLIVVVGLFVLGGIAVVMFALGKPVNTQVRPEAAAPVAVSGAVTTSETGGLVPTQDEKSDPLAIEIPGCVCHSDDPDVAAEHATYRMSECFGCHQDGTSAMGP
ncbi:MAG: hypothetical protein Q7W51_00815 [Coriobacteriia bacterium]|nr:hypothetical protein [Coriobacteriia bacterium]